MGRRRLARPGSHINTRPAPPEANRQKDSSVLTSKLLSLFPATILENRASCSRPSSCSRPLLHRNPFLNQSLLFRNSASEVSLVGNHVMDSSKTTAPQESASGASKGTPVSNELPPGFSSYTLVTEVDR